jgi:hypothetical protein
VGAFVSAGRDQSCTKEGVITSADDLRRSVDSGGIAFEVQLGEVGRPVPTDRGRPAFRARGVQMSDWAERDDSYSHAMDLLSGIGSPNRQVDPRFSDDPRHLLEALGDIQPARRVDPAMPPAELRQVVADIQQQLPLNPEREGRSERTRFITRACGSILRQLDGEKE